MRINLTFLSVIISIVLLSCSEPTSQDRAIPNAKAMYPATYPNGLTAFGQDVHAAIEQSIQSGSFGIPDTTQKIYIHFMIDKNGDIQPDKVESVLPISYATEILKCLKETKTWVPGKDEREKAINVSMILPIKLKGKHGDADISSQCSQAREVINSLTKFKSGIVIIIPYNGCSGCINESIRFVEDASNRYPEQVLGILTGFPHVKEIDVFNKNYDFNLYDSFILDKDRKFVEILPDRNLPLVAVVNNGMIELCRILSGSNIRETLIELEAHFILLEEARTESNF